MSRIVNLCVVHNNEAERLKRLSPNVEKLATQLLDDGVEAIIHEIGPDASGAADAAAKHTHFNRFRRALHALQMYEGFHSLDPRVKDGTLRKFRRRRQLFSRLMKYARNVKIEQEVLFAHAVGWEIASSSKGWAIILESDVVFHKRSSECLCNLVKYMLDNVSEPHVYADLAGGCDVKGILNGWQFEPGGGKQDFAVPGVAGVVFHRLPSLTTNTVAGYMVSAGLAQLFLDGLRRSTPMLAPDWAINYFSLKNSDIGRALCIHSTPTLLSQGSLDGTYASTIDGR